MSSRRSLQPARTSRVPSGCRAARSGPPQTVWRERRRSTNSSASRGVPRDRSVRDGHARLPRPGPAPVEGRRAREHTRRVRRPQVRRMGAAPDVPPGRPSGSAAACSSLRGASSRPAPRTPRTPRSRLVPRVEVVNSARPGARCRSAWSTPHRHERSRRSLRAFNRVDMRPAMRHLLRLCRRCVAARDPAVTGCGGRATGKTATAAEPRPWRPAGKAYTWRSERNAPQQVHPRTPRTLRG